MIGNDVVDLELARKESNWQRKGFLDKIFTKNEQQFILNSDNPSEMVWNLWSRKEATYKIIIQKGGIKGYYPIKIECLNTDNQNGIVVFDEHYFCTKTISSKEFIHSISVTNSTFFNLVKTVKTNENIIKIEGIPFYIFDSKLFPASKTNHGKFQKTVWLQL
jgi:phosphopantetheinyl transferase (holo-ACP synthase)